MEDKGFGPVTGAENEEQGRLECIHGTNETSISQEASLTQRDEEEEEGSETVLMPSVAPLVPPSQWPAHSLSVRALLTSP